MPPRALMAALSSLAAVAFAPPLAGQQNFGSSVAFAEGEILIGQPANFYGPGAVYVYREGNRWSEVAARLFAPDSVLGDTFGASLATDAAQLLVGAPGRGEGGVVYRFLRAGGGAWASASHVAAPSGADGAAFGTAVVLGDDQAFVGAPGAEGSGLVYQIGTTEGGFEVDAVLRPGGMTDARFGSALSLEDDLLLVGAPGASSGAGAAVVYRRGTDGWTQEGVLTAEESQGLFGITVHLDGGRAFVGAPRAGGGVGRVQMFEQDGGSWRASGALTPEGADPGSGFGIAIATVGEELWVGAPNGGGGDGVVHRFAAQSGRWTAVGRLFADSANTAAWPFGFGRSIAGGSDVAVVGMPTRDFGEGRAAILTPTGEEQWDETATVFGEIATAVTGVADGADCEDGTVEIFECNNIEVVSFTPVSELGGARGVWVNDVWGWSDPETGRDYALVSRRDGAAFVDLSDPAEPRLVGSLPRTQGSRPSVWRDIKVYDDHAFVVSDGAGAHGMQVFDLTRLRDVPPGPPVTFTEDAHYDGIYSAHNLVADTASGFLFVVGANGGGETCGGGLHMVDARDPEAPVFAGCYNDPTGANARGYTHDAQCVVYHGPDTRYTGRQICVGSNEVEINIADVTDKDRPVPIGRSSYPNVAYAHQGWFDETQRYFYMGDEGDEVSGLVDGTRTLVWDLSELDDPILVREYIGPVEATDHNLFIRGDRAYLSNYGSGLRVLDISDPENPHEVAFFDSAPVGNNEAGMSSAASGAWSNYPFFESGLVVFTSVREGLFVVRVTPRELIP